MDLQYSDEQQFLREAVRGAVEAEAGLPRVREWVLEGEVDHAPAHALAVRQGWTGIGVEEERGGQGGGLVEVAILAEELGRGAVPADRLYASLLAAQLLDDPDRAAPVAEGERSACLVAAGSAPLDAAAGPSAELVLGAPGADLFLVAGDGRLALHEAATVTDRRLLDHTRTVGDVNVEGDAVAALDLAPDALERLAAWAAVLVAADVLGASQRMLELTVEYVKDRVQFGVPVGSFQAVKHAASEMVVSIEGTRAAVQYAAWAVGEGEPGAVTDAWVAKARAARTGVLVADKALFLHGAVGYTWEHDLGLLFKRAKSGAALWGGAAAHDERIADALALV